MGSSSPSSTSAAMSHAMLSPGSANPAAAPATAATATATASVAAAYATKNRGTIARLVALAADPGAGGLLADRRGVDLGLAGGGAGRVGAGHGDGEQGDAGGGKRRPAHERAEVEHRTYLGDRVVAWVGGAGSATASERGERRP